MKIIKIYAPWCSQCYDLNLRLTEMNQYFTDNKVQIVSVDVNSSEGVKLCEKFKIRMIPTLLFLKEDKELKRLVGIIKDEVIKNTVEVLSKPRGKKRQQNGNVQC